MSKKKTLRLPKTVREVIDLYLALGDLGNSHVAVTERKRVWHLFCAAHGSDALTEVDGLTLKAWIRGRPGWRTANTRRRILRTIKRPFNWCVDHGRIDRNPFRGYREQPGAEGRDMTPAEFAAALRHASRPFRRVLFGLKFSGMRPMELRTLKWAHLRPDLNAIIQQDHKTSHVTKKPRRIPLPRILLRLLLWIRKNQRPPSEYAFLNSKGRPWTRRMLDQNFERVRYKAMLPRDCKLYGCRHFYGTNAILNGNDLATVACLMGHASIRTTQRYLHLADKIDHLTNAAELAIRVRPSARA